MTATETITRILIVDDDADVVQAASITLMPIADQVATARNKADMLERIESENFDCILLDMNFHPGARSGVEGLDMLQEVRRTDTMAGIVLMTAFGGVALAVKGVKAGADDFLLKPWRNETLLGTVRMAISQAQSRRSEATLDGMEKTAITAALRTHKNNIAQAAAKLGISRPALYRRMAKHGI